MPKEIYLHISEPCHEDWSKMSTVQQGRFCESCSKKVVDFSSMSDKQIMDVLSKAAGKTCGRFLPDQLERPMVEKTQPMLSPRKFFLSAFIPAFFLAENCDAQTNVKGKVFIKKEIKVERMPVIMGMTLPRIVEDVKITGVVYDENDNVLENASVGITGTNQKIITNKKGEFDIEFPTGKREVKLSVNHVGFTGKEFVVKPKKRNHIQINLAESDRVKLGEVVVFPHCTLKRKDVIITDKKEQIIQGKVINETGDVVPYATIQLSSIQDVIADSEGVFNTSILTDKNIVELTTSSIGYETDTLKYSLNEL
ncbi:MAG TPA: carboxypeptidase-like regulatory domain-containing protein, partial [Segetibacter sp.]